MPHNTVLSSGGGRKLEYDRVYFWDGGNVTGKWGEILVCGGVSANDMVKEIKRRGYYAVPGSSIIGKPEGVPPAIDDFLAVCQQSYRRAISHE